MDIGPVADGRRIAAATGAGAGVNLNGLLPAGPSRNGVSILTEADTGSAVRPGILVRVERMVERQTAGGRRRGRTFTAMREGSAKRTAPSDGEQEPLCGRGQMP